MAMNMAYKFSDIFKVCDDDNINIDNDDDEEEVEEEDDDIDGHHGDYHYLQVTGQLRCAMMITTMRMTMT